MNVSPNRLPVFLRCVFALGFALSIVVAPPVLADETIYTWTDEAGVRHFSAQPPVGIEYRIVHTLSRAGQEPEPAAAPARTPPATLPEVTVGAPDPELVRERCEAARQNLNLLRQDRPATLRQDEGEPIPLDGAHRQQLIEETELFIAEWC